MLRLELRKSRTKQHCWLNCALLLPIGLLLSPVQAQQNQPLPMQETQSSQTDKLWGSQLQQLSPDQRLKIVRQLIEAEIFLDVPETWKTITQLETALKAVRQFPEPLTQPMLDTLERTLPSGKKNQQRNAASALLYRYGRSAGRAYLARELTHSRDLTAATILALNREDELLNDILRVLDAAPGDYQNDPLLIAALGAWKHPKIEAALFHRFQVALAQEQGGYANFIPALAAQGSRRTIPLIRRIYNSIPTDGTSDIFDLFTKFSTAAALIRLEAREAGECMYFLTNRLKAKEEAFSHAAVVRELGRAGTPEAAETLRQVVSNYLNTKAPPSPPWGKTVETTDADELATLAAEQLGKLKSVELHHLISQLLLRLEKDKQINDKPTPELRERAARVLLDLNSTETKLIEQILGAKWLYDEQLIRRLKPLQHH